MNVFTPLLQERELGADEIEGKTVGVQLGTPRPSGCAFVLHVDRFDHCYL